MFRLKMDPVAMTRFAGLGPRWRGRTRDDRCYVPVPDNLIVAEVFGADSTTRSAARAPFSVGLNVTLI